jgi:hypothetical protein
LTFHQRQQLALFSVTRGVVALNQLARLRESLEQAKRAWTGCHWSTEFGVRQINLRDLRGRQAIVAAKATRGEEAECWRDAAAWLFEVEGDAAQAARLGDLAFQAAERGDCSTATRLFAEAALMERVHRLDSQYQVCASICQSCSHGETMTA